MSTGPPAQEGYEPVGVNARWGVDCFGRANESCAAQDKCAARTFAVLVEEADEIGVLVAVVLHILLHSLGEQPAVGVEVVVDDYAVAAREARMNARAGRNLALERDGDRLVRDGELDLHG